MDRDTLIQQVKDEYARLADSASRQHIEEHSYSGVSLEDYYEKALEKAIRDISAGKYDDYISGLQVVQYIANHKTKSQRIQDTIESTLHNMEIVEEMMTSLPKGKDQQKLKEGNERRAEAVSQMISTMKEEQAKEIIDSDSPDVIGGGDK